MTSIIFLFWVILRFIMSFQHYFQFSEDTFFHDEAHLLYTEPHDFRIGDVLALWERLHALCNVCKYFVKKITCISKKERCWRFDYFFTNCIKICRAVKDMTFRKLHKIRIGAAISKELKQTSYVTKNEKCWLTTYVLVFFTLI